MNKTKRKKTKERAPEPTKAFLIIRGSAKWRALRQPITFMACPPPPPPEGDGELEGDQLTVEWMVSGMLNYKLLKNKIKLTGPIKGKQKKGTIFGYNEVKFSGTWKLPVDGTHSKATLRKLEKDIIKNLKKVAKGLEFDDSDIEDLNVNASFKDGVITVSIVVHFD